ncbi:hypothetical protein WICPIJ_001556 [Wickerhamomyces pijperi]|uniref:Uncharacterized protein n=1 Tax=Wickerhamomyces pijperi TaxID=599730 RepID=A0A9P8QBF8_WICPI|nr:hypothetical protein WICPIJ_001556 [Wickerhamomyces pijperi]
MYQPPQEPQNTSVLPSPQYGYANLNIKTHNYSGNPKPISPSTHRLDGGNSSSGEGFMQGAQNFANNENTKRVGGFIWGQLRGFLCS